MVFDSVNRSVAGCANTRQLPSHHSPLWDALTASIGSNDYMR